MFDINTWKWKEMKKLPMPTTMATSIVVHDGILLLGQ
jgi:N-acetylneuraminic acid mutarotase